MPKGRKNKFAEEIPPRISETRKDIKALLQQKGLIMERGITVLNLDDGQIHYFDSYPEAVEFLKGLKGRWYITTPGIRSPKGVLRK